MTTKELERLKYLEMVWGHCDEDTLTYWTNLLKQKIHTKKVIGKYIRDREKVFKKAGRNRARLMRDPDWNAYINIRNNIISTAQWPLTCVRDIREYLLLKEVHELENENKPYLIPLQGGQTLLNI